MPIERSETKYAGPKLFADSREVIYDTNIAKLTESVQKVYLSGGYHTLVGHFLKGFTLSEALTPEQEAFLRNRLARELIDCTVDAHIDKEAVNSLINYFDHIANVSLSLDLSLEARHLAETYVRGEVNAHA